MTRPYAEVIGDPIAHTKSPLIHNFWLAKLGINAEYRACHVRLDELGDYFARRRGDAEWCGCNVTMPHKKAVAEFLNRLDEDARAIKAVNTVSMQADGLLGSNTDRDGVIEALDGCVKAGAWVAVLGAGGAARAAFRALETMRASEVLVLSRHPQQAVNVARAFEIFAVGVPFDDAESIVEVDLLINATPLGMSGQARLPDSLLSMVADLAEDATVFDMVYSPFETELLAAARSYDKRTIDGLVMLVAQAAASFEIFFGQPAPRKHDAELRALLTA